MIKPPKDKSFFLFGPRGTGKTTWVKSILPKAIYLDLLEAEIFNDLLANPQRLENLIPKDFSDWVIIDEVQRIPELLNEVHRLIENYFSILEDLLIAYRVPVFTKRAKRRLAAHAKFYFFDTGVYRTLRPAGPLDMPEEVEGVAFETFFFQELLALNDALGLGYNIFYWRTSNGAEVDFVLYGNRGLLAFELKRSSRIKTSMLSGLKSFLKDYPIAKAYFIYGGRQYQREDKIEILPANSAFKDLRNILAFSPATQASAFPEPLI